MIDALIGYAALAGGACAGALAGAGLNLILPRDQRSAGYILIGAVFGLIGAVTVLVMQ